MTETKAVRVLPAAVFDALEFGAEIVDGIRSGFYTDANGCPQCAHGLAMFLTDDGRILDNAISVALRDVGISGVVSDVACEQFNVTRGRRRYARLSFSEWCGALGVVRGAT